VASTFWGWGVFEMVKVLFIILFGISNHLVYASTPEVKNVVKFCKEISSMRNNSNYSNERIDEIIQSSFSKDLIYKNFRRYNDIKQRINKISTSNFETPKDAIQGCTQEFKNDFNTFFGNLLTKIEYNEDESVLTSEQRLKGYSILNPEGEGDEHINAPIQVNGLCPSMAIDDCGNNFPVSLEPLEDVASYNTVSPQAFSVSDCECYLNKSTANKEKIISQASEELSQIDHAILNSAGENFLNQYAAFYEDISFYEANSPWALKKNANKDSPIDENVLCVDPNIFKKAIDESCEKNGTAQSKDVRISEILGAFGNDFSGGSQNFSEKFELLKNDIATERVLRPKWRLPPGTKPIKLDVPTYNPITFGSNNGFKSEKFNLPASLDIKSFKPSWAGSDPMAGYTPDQMESIKRTDYEKTRFAYAEDFPEVSVVDELIGIIIRDKDLKSTLDSSMKNNGFPKTPLAAIESMLTDNAANTKTISKIIKKLGQNNKNAAILKLLKTSLEDKSFNKERAKIFKTALSTHPGLKNIVLDASLFNKAAEKVSRNNKGIVRQAEKNKDLFEHFSNRCKGLQEKLAEAVCTNAAALKNKVNTQDLVSILSGANLLPAKDKNMEEAVNLTLCSMNDNNVPETSIFSGLVKKDPLLTSDFKERKFNVDPSKPQNGFSRFAFASAKDPAFKKEQEEIAKSISYSSTSSGQFKSSTGLGTLGSSSPSFSGTKQDTVAQGTALASAKFNAATDSKNTNLNQVEESPAGQKQFENNSQQFNSTAPVNNVIQPVTQISNTPVLPSAKIGEVKDPPVQEEQVSPIREELKKSLKGSDPKKIDGLLGNITDGDAKELDRYRAQSKKDSEEIARLKLEQQALKTQDLKAQLEESQKMLERLKKEKNSVADNNSSGSSNSVGYQEANQEQDEGISNFSGKTNTTNFQATGGSTSGNSSAISGNTQASGQFRDPSSNSNAATGRDLSGKVADGMSLVIKSQSGNGQASAEDPSSELITYLTKNETDSKTLRDLKESGLIYTYEVNENGATVQKKKVIKYTELSVEAKALVDKKISILVEKESSELERQITSLKRTYSIQALKLEILTSNQSKL
jgi:hypothetical protein